MDERVRGPLAERGLLPPGIEVLEGSALLWCAAKDLEQIAADHALLRSSRPNVKLRLLPAQVGLDPQSTVPALITAADLCDEPDSRSVRAGELLLAQVLSRYRESAR